MALRESQKVSFIQKFNIISRTLDKFHLPGNFVSPLVATASRQKPSNRCVASCCLQQREAAPQTIFPLVEIPRIPFSIFSRFDTDSTRLYGSIRAKVSRVVRRDRCTIAIGKQWICIRGLPPG